MASETKIAAVWASGALVFYESAGTQGTTYDVFTMSDTAVKVGSTSQDVDLQWYGTGSVSAIFDCGASSFTLVGVNMVTNTDIAVTIAALTAGDAYSGIRCVVSATNPANQYGVSGYYEADLYGTVAGTVYGFGSWINLDVDVKCGSNWIFAQDNGIYGPASLGSDVSSANLIIGMRMELVLDDGQNPGSLFLFSTNIYSNVLTAMFDINALVYAGGSTGAATGNDYKIPLIKDRSAGQLWYVNLYHA